MKKLFLLFATASMLVVAGCQKENGQKGQNGDPNTPSGIDDPSVSTEDYISQTAMELMDAFDIKNWQADAEFVHKVAKALDSEKYDFSELENWGSSLGAMWRQNPVQDGTTTYYKTVVKLSDAKGHFEEQADGSFKRTDADDFQIAINVDGEKVTATFSCTDTKVLIRVAEGHGYNQIEGPDGYSYTENISRTYLYVPQTATLKILRGTGEFASLTLNASGSIGNPDQPNPYTDNFAVDVNLKISAYTVAVNQVSYTPTKANVDVKILKGSASLITVKADATYELDSNAEHSVPVKSGNIDATIDVLGKIQLKGNIPDFTTFMNTGEAMSQAARDGQEATFKEKVAALEQTFSLKMYFNGASTERASFGLEPLHSTSPYGGEYWTCKPVIRFPNGTSYGVEEYFDEERFGSVMRYGENWWEGIERYISNLFGDI